MPTLPWIGKEKVVNHQDVPFRLLEHQYAAYTNGTQTAEPSSGIHIIHGDNLDAEGKIKLGEYWAQKAGNDFRYFKVYERRVVDGVYELDDFLNLVRGME